MVLFLFLELLRCNFVIPIPSGLVMKQFQIIIILGIIILGIFCYTLLQPGLWKNQISNYCNNLLLKGNLWKISLGDLKGNMLTKITGKGMEIYHPDGYSVVLSDWSVKLNMLNTLIQFPTFDYSITMASMLGTNISSKSCRAHCHCLPFSQALTMGQDLSTSASMLRARICLKSCRARSESRK